MATPRNLLPKDVQAALTEACQAEVYAAHLYQHLANRLQRLGFFGAQKFFLADSEDEMKHYRGLVDFFNDMGSVAPVPAVELMTEAVGSLRDALQAAYDTELQLMQDYATWYGVALKSFPVAAQFILQYLEIQRKSVGEIADWLARLDLAGDDPCGLLIIDKEMGEG